MDTRPPLPPFTRESATLKVRLAEDAWNSRDPARVSLVYTNRTAIDVMFLEELADLKDRHPTRFRLINVLSREQQDVELFNGRIDAAKLTRLFDSLIPTEQTFVKSLPGEVQMVKSRLRSLGCSPCTGAIRSEADTVPKIIAELVNFRSSERANRVIDHDTDGSMEIKKREGYF